MTINLKSVITSGLAAGIIISISVITMIPVVGNEMDTVLANVIGNIANVVYGFMPVKITVIGIIWGLMEFLLATLVASRLYEKSQKKNNQ
jgi:hypothetical protein